MKRYVRTPRYYNGQKSTTHQLSEVMPMILDQIAETFQDRPDLILAAWPDVIGPRLAVMTQAVSFIDGVLTVKVRNSTLNELLRSQNDKKKILEALRSKFPKIEIKTILFRIG